MAPPRDLSQPISPKEKYIAQNALFYKWHAGPGSYTDARIRWAVIVVGLCQTRYTYVKVGTSPEVRICSRKKKMKTLSASLRFSMVDFFLLAIDYTYIFMSGMQHTDARDK